MNLDLTELLDDLRRDAEDLLRRPVVAAGIALAMLMGSGLLPPKSPCVMAALHRFVQGNQPVCRLTVSSRHHEVRCTRLLLS